MHAEFLTQAPTPPNPGVTCVVDTGVNSNHDTDASVIGRQSIYPGDGSDGDPDAHHGTYLAMNIAAPANGWGMVGIAPQTRILSIRAIDNGAHNFRLKRVHARAGPRAVQAKVNGGVNVTTALLALGPRRHRHHRRRPSRPKQRSTMLRAHGISVVAAAGNDGGGVQWPARYGAAVRGRCAATPTAASATRARAARSSISPRWAAAMTARCGTPARRQRSTGSSTSAGLVAGVLTALRAYRPELTPDQAEQLLVSTADSAGAGKVINVAAAFRAAGLGRHGRRLPPPAAGHAAHARQSSPSGTVCPDGGVLSCQKPKLAAAKRKHGKVTLTVATLPARGVPAGPRQAPLADLDQPARSRSRPEHWKKIMLRFGVDRRRALPHRSPSAARRCASSRAKKHHPAPLTCSHPQKRCGEAS